MKLLVDGSEAFVVGVSFVLWIACTVFYFLETRKIKSKLKRFLSSTLGVLFLSAGIAGSMDLYTFGNPVDYDPYLILIYTVASVAMDMVLMYGLTKLAFARQEENPKAELYCMIVGSLAVVFATTMLIGLIFAAFIGIPEFVHP